MERDLTVGTVPKQLFRFAIPLFWANVLQSLYSLVDMAVVGHFVGSAGLAAVSSAAMVGFVISAVCMGVTMGGTVLTAQAHGARDTAGEREVRSALFCVSAIAAALVTAAGLLLYRPLFAWMQVPAEAMPHALEYMEVMCWGTVFVFGYESACALLRGLGDGGNPLKIVAVAALLNILLDLLLVGLWGMGTRGAAIATVTAQGGSFLLALVFLRRAAGKGEKRCRARWSVCRRLLRIGLPSAVQTGAINLSYLLVTGLFNRYGVTVAAAAGIGLKVNTFAAMPCWAVGRAVTTMAGQNLGAGNARRAAETADHRGV